ncbi:hypothetical protein [Bacillus massilinigeriensis]|uniref:hypothetical protein n=1 Tax=Bacillus massilionigeriensis TaxID=1805475 RepID=UPI00096B0935|nr:hypothetical protein [Bacillus massilionigeriensis]
MTKLNEDQFQMIGQYTELLDTIEEAFSYIITSFENIELTATNQLIGDIITAFQQIIVTNDQLAELLKNESALIQNIKAFHGVIQQAEKLEGVWNDPIQKQTIIREQLYPAFAEWKAGLQPQLKLVN